MGMYSQPDVDFGAIGSEMASTTTAWMNATIQIIDPNVRDSNWDEWTNTETNNPVVTLWEGRARVQQLSSTAVAEAGMVMAGVRRVRVQVPLDVDAGFIRKGLQVIVVNGGNDYVLEDMRFTIVSAVNSSYAWVRTIECEADVKSSADGLD